MVDKKRLGFALVVAAMLAVTTSARAQRGGFKFNLGSNNNNSNNNGNKSKDKDKDDDQKSDKTFKNSNSNNDNQKNQSNRSSQQQFQQLLQGGNSNTPNKNKGFQSQNGQPWQNFKGDKNGPSNKWQKNKWNGSNNIQVWSKQFNKGPQPFSSKWFEDHPRAWHYNHPHSNVWVVATIPGVYTWLGWGNYPHRGGNIVYDDNRRFNPADYGDWYPVGVYSLINSPYDSGTRVFQISFDRQGNVAGTYYDMISDATREISGRVQRNTQQVEWSVKSNGALVFHAPLDQLFQPQGIVTVDMPGGQQQWQIVRMQNAGN